ncbi:GMP synthase subunit A [Methanobrevibacter filiformis]|uniref:GMP synthase [glutamine-hydrolyzing] subunit A n=1 Tax=Methanobrevibacter filiformis TaxID=55758 RepID=A0A166BKJ1_9EURY|nr:GMP synthase subunit A [Methanobrevibacter filiformis]KZX13488.1 GMP synthase [Methanobrevibacter filiformis]
MTTLIINNKGQYNHRILRTLKYLKIPVELVSNELEIGEILAKKPVGLILGGGPSIEGAGNCEKYIKELDIPILGICLGHQLIAKTFGGKIATATSESYAQINIDVIEENEIFKELPENLEVWTSHKDEVHELTDDFKILATSKICKFEAIKHKDKPIYGIQFHPEVHHTPKGEKIFENFYNFCKNYKNEN